MGDFELLQAYVRQGDEDAFTEVVNRHLNLVYSAALRQAHDPHAAAEIAQSVFIILARKATTIRKDAVLPGWLLSTTRYTAANARRHDQYRHQLEQRAMENSCLTETETAWKEMAPVLDEALIALGEKDRGLVALRFFAQKSYKEIGATLFISEEGARKRVSRALDRLRAIIAKRGKLLPSAIAAAALSSRATHAAPADLSKTVASVAVAQAGLTAAALPSLVQTTLQSLNWLRWKFIAVRTMAAVSVGTALLLLTLNLPVRHERADISMRTSAAAPASQTILVETSSGPSVALNPVAPTRGTGSQLLFRVLDLENGRPVRDTRLTLTWVTEFPERATNVFTTDRNGECLLPLARTPVKHWNLRIEVFKDGFVPKYVSWSEPQGDAIADVPTEYTTKLDPSVEIGGLVLSEAGQPVAGARVVFSVSGQSPGASHDRERLTMMGNYHTEITDTQGRWRCNHAPARFSMITYRVIHPDYIAGSFGTAALGAVSSEGMTYLAETDLRNGSATFALKPGLVVAGLVTDEQGNPVANAKVTENHDWREISASQVAASDGRFQFRNVGPKDLMLTAQAEGFAPKELTLNPSAHQEKVGIVLSKGGPLRGRVVDDSGAPIPKAGVRLAQDRFNRERSEWKAKTDARGGFEWLSAPTPNESYSIEASGYSFEPNVELAADGNEQVITLHKPGQSASVRISGAAVDAASRLPIESFQVLMGTTEGGSQPSGGAHWVTYPLELKTRGKNGKFSFKTDGSAAAYAFEVRADGYWPAQLTNSGPLTSDCQLDFQLKPGADISGRVQLPDGRPAVGAVVVLCTETAHAYMKLPTEFDLTRSGNVKHAETDSEGRFSFKPQLGIERIRVAHNEGYGEASLQELDSSQAIRLQPWGRVEGTLRIGNHTGRGGTIWLGNWHWRYGSVPSIQLHMEVETDSDGHFVFEGVPPGEREVCYQANLKPGKGGPETAEHVLIRTGRSTSIMIRPWYGQNHRTLVHVQPGQTTQVRLGGSGSAIIGVIKADGITQKIDWQRDVQTFSTKTSRPAAPKREDFSSESDFGAAQKEWSSQEQAFWLSEAGHELQLNCHQYVPLFTTDGSFRIDDVLPGIYQLTIRISDPNVTDTPFGGKFLGSIEEEIAVPDATGSSDQSPLDLGILELQHQPE